MRKKPMRWLAAGMALCLTLGLTVFFGVFVVSANFIIDLIYGLIDPRIRVTK